jgi:putative SOS response-associated peptidase YedK
VAEVAGPWPEAAPGATLPAVVAEPHRRLVAMRWGMIPMGRVNARGRPVLDTIVNARSETLFAKSAFVGLGRCILPVSGWYEWTGPPRRRVRWTIRAPERPILAFAAVWDRWRAPGGAELRSLATVTCAPNAEVAAVHDRMPAILEPDDWARWLGEQDADPAALLRPFSGLLEVVAGAS